MTHPHLPVLLNEVIEIFSPCKLETFVDGTVGAGGHAEAILAHHPEIKSFHAFDQDLSALALAKARLPKSVHFHHTNFSKIGEVLGQATVDGLLIDIGVSSMQIDTAERGFSFQKEGPLDMRMDQTASLTAYEIVNHWSEAELGTIFREYGEEKFWRKAAGYICAARKEKAIETTWDLRQILKRAIRPSKEGIDPATRVFQALRIAVNGELEHLEIFLKKAIELLKPQGRLAVISFHSLEDRMIKQFFQFEASDKLSSNGPRGLFLDKEPTVKIVAKKAIVASEEEIELNRRSRSAKMRVIEKL
jgi:16S rRNA (cytosine1402-N4)-methyltransferase